MKLRNNVLVMFQIFFMLSSFAQESEIVPDLSNIHNSKVWNIHNRTCSVDGGVVSLNAVPGDGVLWLKSQNFSNGMIELDIKGKDIKGRSFAGVAFHGQNDSIYDVVYFRAFNFKNPAKDNHSVQYISHPNYTWHKLRKESPKMYENKINPVPDPNEWFHVTLYVNYPSVEVYVNNSRSPSLSIKQLSKQKAGWIGFWVGNSSEGEFKNLKITHE